MDERKKKAFDFAADITKQLITLATGVIGAIVTFGDHGLSLKAGGIVGWALSGYGFSAAAGALTLMALTGQLGSPAMTEETCSTYAPQVRGLSAVQVLSFLFATGLLAYAAVKALR
jgi:hypothetical protein